MRALNAEFKLFGATQVPARVWDAGVQPGWRLPGWRRSGGARAAQFRAVPISIGAVLAAAFKKIKNRGNELKDLLQRKGITETALSKRTRFRAEKVRIEAKESTISGARRAVARAGRAYMPRHPHDKLSHNRAFRWRAVRPAHVAVRGRLEMSPR